MKAGLERGKQVILEVEVTPEMVVEFDGRKLHPFYPTYWACHHAELVCRMMLEPHLEEHEDGIGSGLFIHHHGPALVGQKLRFIATATRIRSHHLACHFEIMEGERRVAHGDVHQVILSKARLAQMRAEAAHETSAVVTV